MFDKRVLASFKLAQRASTLRKHIMTVSAERHSLPLTLNVKRNNFMF